MNQREGILLTKEGIVKLNDELNHLINEVRPKVIIELKEARAQGDLSENADYDAARNRQAEVEGRIKEIEDLLSKAQLINEKKSVTSSNQVRLGSTVRFLNLLLNTEMELKIVGAVEADPFENTISNESPIARAMIGAGEGDILEVGAIQNNYKIKILQIS